MDVYEEDRMNNKRNNACEFITKIEKIIGGNNEQGTQRSAFELPCIRTAIAIGYNQGGAMAGGK